MASDSPDFDEFMHVIALPHVRRIRESVTIGEASYYIGYRDGYLLTSPDRPQHRGDLYDMGFEDGKGDRQNGHTILNVKE